MTATIFEAKTNLSDLIRKAQAGEQVVITSGREKLPVVELKPIAPPSRKRIGFLAHLHAAVDDSAFFDPLPEAELKAWEGKDE